MHKNNEMIYYWLGPPLTSDVVKRQVTKICNLKNDRQVQSPSSFNLLRDLLNLQ